MELVAQRRRCLTRVSCTSPSGVCTSLCVLCLSTGFFRASDFFDCGCCFRVGMQVSLWLLRVGVSVVARAEILPVDNLMGKLREVAGEETAAYIEAIDVKSFEARNGGLSSKVVKQKEVFDGAYTDLATFVLEQEKNIVVTSRELGAGDTATLGGGATSENAAIGVPAASTAPVSTVSPTGKRSFEREMVLKSRQRGNDPPQWAWVRGVNLEKWQRFEDPISAAVAQATGAVP